MHSKTCDLVRMVFMPTISFNFLTLRLKNAYKVQKYCTETNTIVSALSKLKFTGLVFASTIITRKVMIENVEGAALSAAPRYC